MEKLRKEVHLDSKVVITIESPTNNEGKPIYMPWWICAYINVEHILLSIENVMNSNETLLLREKVTMKADLSDLIRGQRW